jgi:hypothetical protein
MKEMKTKDNISNPTLSHHTKTLQHSFECRARKIKMPLSGNKGKHHQTHPRQKRMS